MAHAGIRLQGGDAHHPAGRRHARGNVARGPAHHDGPGFEAVGMISPRESAMATMGVFVYLEDVDKHHAQACAAGAEIVQAPYDEPWGRTYTVRDLDGHPWFFATPPR